MFSMLVMASHRSSLVVVTRYSSPKLKHHHLCFDHQWQQQQRQQQYLHNFTPKRRRHSHFVVFVIIKFNIIFNIYIALYATALTVWLVSLSSFTHICKTSLFSESIAPIIGGVIGGVVFVAIVIFVVCYLLKKRRSGSITRKDKMLAHQNVRIGQFRSVVVVTKLLFLHAHSVQEFIQYT